MSRRGANRETRSFDVALGAFPAVQLGDVWGAQGGADYLGVGVALADARVLRRADCLWFHNLIGYPADIVADEAVIGTGIPYVEPTHIHWREMMQPDDVPPTASTGERGFMNWGTFIALARAAKPTIKIGIDCTFLNAARTGPAADPWADGTAVAFDVTDAAHRTQYVRWVRHLYDALTPDYFCYGVEFASDLDPADTSPTLDGWITSRVVLMQQCYNELSSEAAAGLLCGPSVYLARWRKNYLASAGAAAVLDVVGGAWLNAPADPGVDPFAGLGNCFFLSDHAQSEIVEAGSNPWTSHAGAPKSNPLMDLDQYGLADLYNTNGTAGATADRVAHVFVSETSAWEASHAGVTHNDQSANWRKYLDLQRKCNLVGVHQIVTEDPDGSYADQHGLASIATFGADPSANFNAQRGLFGADLGFRKGLRDLDYVIGLPRQRMFRSEV